MSAGRSRSRCLACLLTHADTPVPADALAEALWPHPERQSAGSRVRVAVARLRRALAPLDEERSGGPLIETVTGGYLLRAAPGRSSRLCLRRAWQRRAERWPPARASGGREARAGSAVAVMAGTPPGHRPLLDEAAR